MIEADVEPEFFCMNRRAFVVAVASLGCSALPVIAQNSQTHFPDIVAVKVTARAGGVFDFDVTVSSPYDSPKRYADAFRIVGASGQVYGERVLLHDHADEQPFTRELYGVIIPAGITRVRIEGRDQVSGYGGKTQDVALPGR